MRRTSRRSGWRRRPRRGRRGRGALARRDRRRLHDHAVPPPHVAQPLRVPRDRPALPRHDADRRLHVRRVPPPRRRCDRGRDVRDGADRLRLEHAVGRRPAGLRLGALQHRAAVRRDVPRELVRDDRAAAHAPVRHDARAARRGRGRAPGLGRSRPRTRTSASRSPSTTCSPRRWSRARSTGSTAASSPTAARP